MLAEFAERFTRLRQDRGYTQQKIAEKLGVTPQAVSKWENGSSLPDAEMIRFIAQLMDCTTDYLLSHQASALSQRNMESVQRQAEIENVIQKPVLVLEVGMGLVDMLVAENNNNYALIHKMRLELGERMGIIVPVIQLRDNITLGEKEYRILLHGREVEAPIRSEYPCISMPGKMRSPQPNGARYGSRENGRKGRRPCRKDMWKSPPWNAL